MNGSLRIDVAKRKADVVFVHNVSWYFFADDSTENGHAESTVATVVMKNGLSRGPDDTSGPLLREFRRRFRSEIQLNSFGMIAPESSSLTDPTDSRSWNNRRMATGSLRYAQGDVFVASFTPSLISYVINVSLFDAVVESMIRSSMLRAPDNPGSLLQYEMTDAREIQLNVRFNQIAGKNILERRRFHGFSQPDRDGSHERRMAAW